MGKSYRAVLVTDTPAVKYLEKSCRRYRHAFNATLDIQLHTMFYGVTYEEQLLDVNTLFEKVQGITSGTALYKNTDKGIIRRAVEASYDYFHEWWNQRNSSSIADVPSSPSYMKATSYFRTTTILKVSKGGFVYLPKYGRIKLRSTRDVPSGSYKNVMIKRVGTTWYILMESVIETPQEYALSGSADVFIDYNGNVSFGDKVYPNILTNASYRKASRDLKTLVKKLRKAGSNFKGDRKTVENNIEYIRFRRENIRTMYFQQIVKDIASVQPAEISLVYVPKDNERQSFSSQFFKDSQILALVKMIQKKLISMGTKINYSDNIKEEFLNELNSKLVIKFDKEIFSC